MVRMASDCTRERCANDAEQIPEEEALRAVEALHQTRAEIHSKEIKEEMERTTVHKRNRQKAPRLCTQEVAVRVVYLDQCKRLKEARQREGGSGNYSRKSDHQ